MLQFDRLKLATSSQFITNLNHTKFLEIPIQQGDYYYKYQQDSPFSLTITNKPRKSELVIDFTGKVLKDAYPSLISCETIRQCFDNICAIRICDLDIDAILNNSEVCLCDVTQDIVCNHPMAEIKRHIKASIKNYDKWLFKNCRNNGLEIYNSVTTSRRFKRFILYDKAKEMKRAENKGTVQVLTEPTCTNHNAVVYAQPASGYRFDHWSTGSTDNPYSLTVVVDTVITAYFVLEGDTQGIEGVERDDMQIIVSNGHIVVEGVEQKDIHVYDITGRTRHNHALPSGVYIVKIGQLPARKVVVLQ